MARVTVVVPNYNHASYLRQRVESILAQTFTDFELWIFDDASTDHSLEVIQTLKTEHPQIQVNLNTKNSGSPFAQWQKAFQQSKSEYLWIAESDDFCEPQLLEELVSLLDKNTNCGLAYAQSILVDEHGKHMNNYLENLQFIYKSNIWDNDFVKNGQEACREWLLFHNPIPNASGVLFRCSTWSKTSGPPQHMRLNGDWHFYAQILAQSDLAFSAKALNYFRVHTNTQREKARLSANVYQEIIAINTFIREHINQSEANADKALQKVAKWWIGSLPYQKKNKENRIKNKQLHAFFKAYNSNLNWHIFTTYIITYLRSFLVWMGILKPLKKLRKRLFPSKYFEY